MNHNREEAVRALLRRHGFHFSKSKGQNFLTDPELLARIADASGADRSCGVLEVGPGAGSLTAALAERAGKVTAVELDRSLLPVLQETLEPYDNVEILSGDALALDLTALARERFPGLTPMICANVPYQITTPLLEKFVEASCYRTVTVLVQREVARRLSAPSGSRAGGAFSLFLQYHMETELLFDVPREHFLPPPQVDSAVIRCVRRECPAVRVSDEAFFFRVVRGGFLLRRKTLANSLAAALPGISRETAQRAILHCGLPENIRGEALTLEQFAALADALGEADPQRSS